MKAPHTAASAQPNSAGGPGSTERASGGPASEVSARADVDAAVARQLLPLAMATPLSSGLGAVTRSLLEGAATLLPHCALGLCVVLDTGDTPLVELRLPAGEHNPPGRDPTRLFPSFQYERVFELGGHTAGSTFHVAWHGAALDDGEQALLDGLVWVMQRQITQAREVERTQRSERNSQRLQAQIIQAEKLASLGQITAGVVHELNNPLTSIIAYSDYLVKRAEQRRTQGDDVDDDLERLYRIGEAASRILKFSRDLIAYARPSTDIPGPVDLREVVAKAMVFCEHQFSKSEISVIQSIPDGLPPVRGVSGQLTQVFVNLFTNAAHAMSPGGGSLEIEAHSDGDRVVAVVRDSGVGISPSYIDQIFDPFFTTKTDGAGTGLGLSIVRDIVEQHGGALTAHSEAGGGAEFRLTLSTVAVPPNGLD